MIPSTIKTQRTSGDRETKVLALGATDVPDHNGGRYAHRITQKAYWDGHHRDGVKGHITTWTLPEKVREVKDRVEQSLEDGIPNQKRTMLRNQEWGQLDDRHITDLALGYEVEKPFQRWSRKVSDEVRVAICIDATACAADRPEKVEARMCMAAGVASALEGLDYEVSITAATLRCRTGGGRPRTTNSEVFATAIKSEEEPMVDSGFAYFSDSGIQRLMRCWISQGNGYSTHLTDREWRELTDADLFVYIGASGEKVGRYYTDAINDRGRPEGAPIGPKGEDAIRLRVNAHYDVDAAVVEVERYFNELFAEVD